jgi:hypothetical protein
MPHGGKRAGAGRPKKPLAEKLLDGNPGRRKLTVLEFKPAEVEPLMPPDYLGDAAGGVDKYPGAAEIFERVTDWLEQTGCLRLIPPEHITEYSLLKARWLECEAKNARHGLLAKHPTSGQPIVSPFVRMGIDYLKAADAAWNKIWMIVSQNSERTFQHKNPNVDVMERLLNTQRNR